MPEAHIIHLPLLLHLLVAIARQSYRLHTMGRWPTITKHYGQQGTFIMKMAGPKHGRRGELPSSPKFSRN